MRFGDAAVGALAIVGVATARGAGPLADAWPSPRATALLFVLPAVAVAIVRLRATRARRMRRFSLGW